MVRLHLDSGRVGCSAPGPGMDQTVNPGTGGINPGAALKKDRFRRLSLLAPDPGAGRIVGPLAETVFLKVIRELAGQKRLVQKGQPNGDHFNPWL